MSSAMVRQQKEHRAHTHTMGGGGCLVHKLEHGRGGSGELVSALEDESNREVCRFKRVILGLAGRELMGSRRGEEREKNRATRTKCYQRWLGGLLPLLATSAPSFPTRERALHLQ